MWASFLLIWKHLPLGCIFLSRRVAAEIYYPTSCRSCFSSVHLVFEEFQDAWRSNKENPSAYWNATLSCPFVASNHANSYLVPISFWSRSGCWPCLEFVYPISFYRRASRFVVFQTKVAHLCFCLVRIQMPLPGGILRKPLTATRCDKMKCWQPPLVKTPSFEAPNLAREPCILGQCQLSGAIQHGASYLSSYKEGACNFKMVLWVL